MHTHNGELDGDKSKSNKINVYKIKYILIHLNSLNTCKENPI